MRDYADGVLDLANIGIASPEYALANGHRQAQIDCARHCVFREETMNTTNLNSPNQKNRLIAMILA